MMYNRRKSQGPLDSHNHEYDRRRKTRSSEAFARHKQRYGEILERRKMIDDRRNDIPPPPVRYGRNEYKDKSKIICRYFYRFGTCTKGESCIFSHDCTPLNSKDLKLCHYFVKNEGCKKTAEECKYSHEVHKFLCRQNVINGFCNLGGNCQFNHMPQDSIKRMDDTEKLKFCYNNKKFLVKALINFLINENWINPQHIGVCDDVKGLTAIVTSYNNIPEKIIRTVPWYLHYTLLILEKDLNAMQTKNEQPKP